MSANDAGLERGATVTQLSVPGVQGQRKQFEDKDWTATGYVKPFLSGDLVTCRLVKNASGGTLSAGAQIRYDWSNGDGIIEAAAACGAGEISDANVDPYVGSSGVASAAYFWADEEGPTKAINSASTSITAGDTIRTAASGKVLENTGANSGAATFGRALETNATADALFRVYRYGRGATVASSAAQQVAGITATVGAEASNVINVAIQFYDQNGADMAVPVVFEYYISDDANGQTVSGDMGTVAVGTDGTIIKEHTDDVAGLAVSEADGDFDMDFTNTAAETNYFQIVLGNKLFTTTVTHA